MISSMERGFSGGLEVRRDFVFHPYVLALGCSSIYSHLPVLPSCDALHDYVAPQHLMQLARMSTA